MSTYYERELKGILSADKQLLQRITKARDLITATNYQKIEKNPFMVIRAAGSFGVDLIAISSEMALPIEVKTSVYKVLRFGGTRMEEQAEEMVRSCERCGVMPIYAYRLKKPPKIKMDPWSIFTIEMEGLKGFQRFFHQKIPKLRTTAQGNYVMEWEEGIPLSEFIFKRFELITEWEK